MGVFMRLKNPYTLEQTLEHLRFILSVRGGLYLGSPFCARGPGLQGGEDVN